MRGDTCGDCKPGHMCRNKKKPKRKMKSKRKRNYKKKTLDIQCNEIIKFEEKKSDERREGGGIDAEYWRYEMNKLVKRMGKLEEEVEKQKRRYEEREQE